MLNIDFSKISTELWLTIILLLFATVVPGFLLFFICDQYLFINLETTKLIILSFAITSPIWLINTITYLYWETKHHGEIPNDLLRICSMAGSIFSILIFYITIISNTIWEFSVKENLILVFFLQVLVLGLIWWVEGRQFGEE